MALPGVKDAGWRALSRRLPWTFLSSILLLIIGGGVTWFYSSVVPARAHLIHQTEVDDYGFIWPGEPNGGCSVEIANVGRAAVDGLEVVFPFDVGEVIAIPHGLRLERPRPNVLALGQLLAGKRISIYVFPVTLRPLTRTDLLQVVVRSPNLLSQLVESEAFYRLVDKTPFWERVTEALKAPTPLWLTLLLGVFASLFLFVRSRLRRI